MVCLAGRWTSTGLWQRPFRNWPLGVQVIEQRLGLFQIERAEAFGEPAADRSEQLACLIALAPIAPKVSKVPCGSKLKRAGALASRDRQRVVEQ